MRRRSVDAEAGGDGRSRVSCELRRVEADHEACLGLDDHAMGRVEELLEVARGGVGWIAVGAGQGVDILIGIEGLRGSDFGDTLTGNGGVLLAASTFAGAGGI